MVTLQTLATQMPNLSFALSHTTAHHSLHTNHGY